MIEFDTEIGALSYCSMEGWAQAHLLPCSDALPKPAWVRAKSSIHFDNTDRLEGFP